MNNYDSVIEQMTGYGLVIEGGLETGRFVRTYTEDDRRERRGWYYLHEVTDRNHQPLLVGSYGIWRGNDQNAQRIRMPRNALDADQQEALRARLKADRLKAKARREREAAKAAARATAVWQKALPTGEADYLAEKGVQAHGLRFTESGAVVIPMLDVQGNIHGLQFILPKKHPRRKKTGRNKEYWPKGLTKRGHFFQIGAIRDLVLVVEGYATGATLHEATGLPVVVAFDANNLVPVSVSIHDRYPRARILVCADDDHLQKCRACGKVTPVDDDLCAHCGEPHRQKNAGVESAKAAALAVDGQWMKPEFRIERKYKKHTDFNDLFLAEGLQAVRAQVDARLAYLKWDGKLAQGSGGAPAETGGGGREAIPSHITVEEGVRRYWGTYGFGGDLLFDEVERRLIHKKDVANLMERHGIDKMREHPDWRVARDTEVGFDPTGEDTHLRCNMWGGWPTTPKPGKCDLLLETLEWLCSKEKNAEEVYQWILKWIAYPIQNPGAKMHSALVIHGPQGTGKSRFFEAIVEIYGEYGRVLGQEALEDKFNADWAEKKLFILADEVLARADMYHVKNRLKSFITGKTIRVNPKNVAAHNERNCMNIVFLSNERQPVALEEDDRRHCVIWSPPKLPPAFYEEVTEEINNGGIEALHQYLLDLDLGDFRPWTHPPMTNAKRDLVELGKSPEEHFYAEWKSLEVLTPDGTPLPFCPVPPDLIYQQFRKWCERNGVRAPGRTRFTDYLKRIPGWRAPPNGIRIWSDWTKSGEVRRRFIFPSQTDMNDALKHDHAGIQENLMESAHDSQKTWLMACWVAFNNAVNGTQEGGF